MNFNYPFKPLKKVKLYEEVAEQIKKSIFNGHLAPGDLLPSERELSTMFKVGRPTIREAIRTLNVLGLIEMNEMEKGYLVRENDVAQYMETLGEQLSWLIKPDKKTMSDLAEVRKYIELGVAHAAARRATDQDLNELQQMLDDMKSALDDFDAYFPIATDFHKKMALITGNRFFYIIWMMVQDILMKGYEPFLTEIFPEGPIKLYEVNTLLLEAIKSRDPEKIETAMQSHAKAEDIFNT